MGKRIFTPHCELDKYKMEMDKVKPIIFSSLLPVYRHVLDFYRRNVNLKKKTHELCEIH
jgi:hypothetical protein